MEPTHTLVNGCPTDFVSAGDRGLLYGDGVFRTLRVSAGRALWWPEQYAKLASDAARLAIPCPSRADWEADIAACLNRAGEQDGEQDGVLRLTLTRGEGTRGYAPPNTPTPTRLVQFSPLPADVDLAALGQIHLCGLRLASQPALAGVKHLNRLEQVLARAEWTDPAVAEGLLLDAEDRLISGLSSNLFLMRGGVLFTPRLDRCGVAGVARDRFIARAPALGHPVTVTDLSRADLDAADALFLCNSVRGLRWVAEMGGRSWALHPAFTALRECLWAD